MPDEWKKAVSAQWANTVVCSGFLNCIFQRLQKGEALTEEETLEAHRYAAEMTRVETAEMLKSLALYERKRLSPQHVEKQ